MRFVGLTLALSFAGVAALGAMLATSPGARDSVHAQRERDLAAVPDTARRAAIARRADAFAAAVARLARVEQLSGIAAAVAGRAAIAAGVLPILAATMALGVVAGLLRRHLLRQEYGFASLTWSFAGKAGVAASIACYAVAAVAPLAPPLWTLYLACLGAAGGAALYVGNLPPKI